MDRSRDHLAALEKSIDILHSDFDLLLEQSVLDSKNIEVRWCVSERAVKKIF